MSLNVENLSFYYSKKSTKKILDNINFKSENGQCIAILGPNGAGKSTLLKNICHILNYQEGNVLIEDKDTKLLGANERAKKVGYVAQKLEFADSTVFDVILSGRKPHIKWEASNKDLEIVSSLIEKLDISKISLNNINKISGGEAQKVAIARALAQQPSILLFDEPTSNLDIKNQLEVIKLIKEITHDLNITVIVAMHDLNLALRFADSFILMKEGTIYSYGNNKTINEKSILDIYNINCKIELINEYHLVIPE